MVPQERCYGCMNIAVNDNKCRYCGFIKDSAPASTHHLQPGTVLQGKYLLGKVIGQGGFGITYIAWDLVFEMPLAVKECFPRSLASRSTDSNSVEHPLAVTFKEQYQKGLALYLEEAKTLARFADHPNVVTVRDFFSANNTAYIVMNYIEGLDLEEYLMIQGGTISATTMLKNITPIMEALHDIHQAGVVHRDISPKNIIIRNDGHAVLIDFGTARQGLNISRGVTIFHKLGYSPLEQQHSDGKQGPWTDIYALAATYYRCITGQPPPEAMDRVIDDKLLAPSALGIDIDKELEDVMMKALAVHVSDRYQTIAELEKDLNNASKKDNSLKTASSLPLIGGRLKLKHLVFFLVGVLVYVLVNTSFVSRIGQPSGAETGQLIGSEYHASNNEQINNIQGVDETYVEPAAAPYYPPSYIEGKPIDVLEIGDRVRDQSWEWEYRFGFDYADTAYTLYYPRLTKPIVWIVVAFDHYGTDSGVTLLSEDIIARFPFDKSLPEGGSNHWGLSGLHGSTPEAGLRPWLNSTGIYKDQGFYNTLPENFQSGIRKVSVPNKAWDTGENYRVFDKIFIPSATELGSEQFGDVLVVGEPYPYFLYADTALRLAALPQHESTSYWTRSPLTSHQNTLCYVDGEGNFSSYNASYFGLGVRPAVNVRSQTLVSEEPDDEGIYEILWIR